MSVAKADATESDDNIKSIMDRILRILLPFLGLIREEELREELTTVLGALVVRKAETERQHEALRESDITQTSREICREGSEALLRRPLGS